MCTFSAERSLQNQRLRFSGALYLSKYRSVQDVYQKGSKLSLGWGGWDLRSCPLPNKEYTVPSGIAKGGSHARHSFCLPPGLTAPAPLAMPPQYVRCRYVQYVHNMYTLTFRQPEVFLLSIFPRACGYPISWANPHLWGRFWPNSQPLPTRTCWYVCIYLHHFLWRSPLLILRLNGAGGVSFFPIALTLSGPLPQL